MNIIYILGIAFALSIDSLTVSVINGVTIKNLKFRQACAIAFSFGIFQAVMPFIGWGAGFLFKEYIEHIAHWGAFILLLIIGSKMIYESLSKKNETEDNKEEKNNLNIFNLITLSIATSIDALAVGLSFSLINIAILFPAIVIGSVTFLVCLTGVYIGGKIGRMFALFEKKLEAAGGIVLIAIGVKILLPYIV